MPNIHLTDAQLADLRVLASHGKIDLENYLDDSDPAQEGFTAEEADNLRGVSARAEAVVDLLEQARGPRFVVAFNWDYYESLTSHTDLAGALREIRGRMEIEAEIDDPTFADDINTAYEACNWKGLAIYELDAVEGDATMVEPETLHELAANSA